MCNIQYFLHTFSEFVRFNCTKSKNTSFTTGSLGYDGGINHSVADTHGMIIIFRSDSNSQFIGNDGKEGSLEY